MRRTLRFMIFYSTLFFTLGPAPPAHAQDTPRVDVFAGYSYLRANTVVSGTPINLNGVSGSLAYNFNNWLGVVGDVGYYHQGSITTTNNLSLTLSSYQFGLRASSRRHEHLIPFGQALFGAGHAGGTLYTTSLGAGLPPLGTSNAFLLTAGGGVDWKLTHGFGIRLFQAEYLYSQFKNGGTHGNQQNNARLSAGLVFSFGKR